MQHLGVEASRSVKVSKVLEVDRVSLKHNNICINKRPVINFREGGGRGLQNRGWWWASEVVPLQNGRGGANYDILKLSFVRGL